MNGALQTCRDCRRLVFQREEKAVGSGEWALVWMTSDGVWICPATGNEHEPQD